MLARCVREHERRLFVAEAGDGRLLGFAAAALARGAGPVAERARGEIDWLFVREEARRRGTGRALVAAALAWLGGEGAARVEIQVAHGNAGGRAFWQALGFAPTMDVLERPL